MALCKILAVSAISTIKVDSPIEILSEAPTLVNILSTIPILTLSAGTKVYVAIDGNAGSNCAYSISGINILSVLDEGISNFSGWQQEYSNVLKWSKTNEISGYYEVEKSTDGNEFYVIGKLPAKTNNDGVSNYTYEDRLPAAKTFYRLKRTDISGKIALSNILKIERKADLNFRLSLINPATDMLHVNVMASRNEQMNYCIINTQGSIVLSRLITFVKGNNRFEIDISSLPFGTYFFLLKNKDGNFKASFLKID